MAESTIASEEQYENALEEVFHLLQTHPYINSAESEKLNRLIAFIEQYESIHYPMRIKQ